MRRAALLAAAAIAAVLAAGCGEEERPNPPATQLSQAPTVKCVDWIAAGRADRAAIMEDLEQAFSRRGEDGARGEIVSRAKGIEVIDRACAQPFARNFRLWKLYERAVAFG